MRSLGVDVGCVERSTGQRFDVEHREEARRDRAHADLLGRGVARHRCRPPTENADAFERARALLLDVTP